MKTEFSTMSFAEFLKRVKILAKKKLTPKKTFTHRVESFIPENDVDEIPPQAEAQPPPPPDNEANEPEIPNATNEHDPLEAEPEEEYHSAHSDSEVEGEPDSSDDEFQPDGATQDFVNQTSNVYNENESGEHPQPPIVVRDLELKMQFNNMKEFRDYIRTYAILKNFVWEYVKNDSDKVRLKCHDKECNWLCYAKQKRNEATVVVKTLRAEHTCHGDPSGKNPLANSDWVAKQLEEDVRVHHKSYTVRDIVIECWKSEYHLVKTYAAAYEKAISPLPNYRTWPEPSISVLPPQTNSGLQEGHQKIEREDLMRLRGRGRNRGCVKNVA
ncbi:hypothetical protein LguiB_016569 [Lonicera macranthoides]